MRSLANSLLANAETRVIYRQESDQLSLTAKTLGLTGTEQHLLPGLGTGQGLWRIKERSFVVQHQMHPNELSLFDTGLTPFRRSSRYESRPVARGRGQGDWSDHDEQQEASHPGAGRP